MILLDTCVLLWLADDQGKLSRTAVSCLARHRSELFISAITAWEIAYKHGRGKLKLPLAPVDWLELAILNHHLREVALDRTIPTIAAGLPQRHADPCDRFLIATALSRGWSLLTPDEHIHAYPEARAIW